MVCVLFDPLFIDESPMRHYWNPFPTAGKFRDFTLTRQRKRRILLSERGRNGRDFLPLYLLI